ncbi:MAG: LPD38 domain-containing protein [Sneathiella sp.]|uniref:LPD38 domain-containing protein n=1 Tax=Sneathiella sp. TaxID=1964365 RepID=UPI0030014EBB
MSNVFDQFDETAVAPLAAAKPSATLEQTQGPAGGDRGNVFDQFDAADEDDRPFFSFTETDPKKLSSFQSAISSGIQGFGGVIADTLKAGAIADAKMGFIDKPEDGILFQAGEWISDLLKEKAPVNPDEQGTLPDKIGSGLGSTAGFLAGGLAGGTSKGALAMAGVLGSGSQATNQYMDALDNGASIDDAYNAAGLGALVGSTEAVPIVKLLDRLDKGTSGGIKRIIINAAKGGTEEGLQEAFQSIASNLIASDLVKYDAERKTFESTGEDAGIGFGIGALFNTVASIFGLKARGRPSTDSAPIESQETETTRPESVQEEEAAVADDSEVNVFDEFDDKPVRDTVADPDAPPVTESETAEPEGDTTGSFQPKLTTDDSQKIRDLGDTITQTIKAHPEYNPGKTGTEPDAIHELSTASVSLNGANSRLGTELTQRDFGLPFGTLQREKSDIKESIAWINENAAEAVKVLKKHGVDFDFKPLSYETYSAPPIDYNEFTKEKHTALADELLSSLKTGDVFHVNDKALVVTKSNKAGLVFQIQHNGGEAFKIGSDRFKNLRDLIATSFWKKEFGLEQKSTGSLDRILKRSSKLEKNEDGIWTLVEGKQTEKKSPPKAAVLSEQGELSFSRAPAANQTQAFEAGDKHVGMRQDDAGSGTRDMEDPIRRDAILKDFSSAIGVPIYKGRISPQSKALGFYRNGVEEIRLRNGNDIEVAAHEVAHLLDDRVPELSKQWKGKNRNKVHVDELRGVSYDKKKLNEGFAEFVRLWTTQPDKAADRAPSFNGWFNDFVAASEHGPALLKAREDMLAWFNQDALKRARSKIGAADEVLPTDLKGRLRQAVVDDLHGLKVMEQDLTGEIAPVGLYETARLSRAKHSMIEGALTIGAPQVNGDGSHSFVGKGLKQILEPVANRQEEFWTYAAGRSARELMGQGREHLFTKNEIAAMTNLETPAFKKAFDEYQIWNGKILDFAEAKGVINAASRNMWKRAEYIPFYRVGARGAKGSKGTEGNWKGIQRLTGGTENLQDIAKNVVQNAATLIDVSLSNEVRLEAAKLAKGPRGAKFMAQIPKEQIPVSVETPQIEQALIDAMGADSKQQLPIDVQIMLDQVAAELGPYTEFIIRGQAPQGGNIVAALQNGKPIFFEVADPLVLRSMISLNRPSKSWITRILSLPKRIGQASITLTPDFMAANLARDTMLGSIMSRSGFKPVLDSLNGIKSRIAQDKNYKDFIANGGGFSSHLVDEEAFTAHLEKFYTKKGINPHNVLNVPRKLFFALEVMADAVEMSTRLGEFRRAQALGEHPRHAAYRAREVSTDFAMRGGGLRRGHELHDRFDDVAEAVGFMYDTVIFLKAATNGIDRTYRGFTEDKNKTAIAVKTGLIGLVSAALWYLNKDNPLYQDLEDWDKDTNWHFFVPKLDEPADAPIEERFHHFRFPKLWEIGAVSSIAERTMETIETGDPVKGAKHVGDVVLSTFGLEYIPQAIAPFYEVYANKNRFTGRPVEGMAQQAVQEWARANLSTSQTLRKAGETVRDVPILNKISPVQAQHLLRGYFNTWATYGLSISDAIFFDNAPDLRVDQYPVIKRFYRQNPSRSSKAVGEFYDALKEATETRRTIKQLLLSDREAMAREQEFTEANRLYKPLTNASKFMRGFGGEIKKVYNTKDLSATQELAKKQSKIGKGNLVVKAQRAGAWRSMGALKAMMIDNLVTKRNDFAKKVIEDMRKSGKAEEAPQ